MVIGGATIVKAAANLNSEGSTPTTNTPNNPYQRHSNATTKAQRESVQGQPCVDCGKGGKMNADHKKPLVKEYYETGKIDKEKMKDKNSVKPQCPEYSNKQGGELKKYSTEQKEKLKL